MEKRKEGLEGGEGEGERRNEKEGREVGNGTGMMASGYDSER